MKTPCVCGQCARPIPAPPTSGADPETMRRCPVQDKLVSQDDDACSAFRERVEAQ